MGSYFLDTSAVVKRYVQEPGTEWILALCEPDAGHELLVASVAEVELCAALARKVREQALDPQTALELHRWYRRDCAGQYLVRILDPAVIASAIRLVRAHPLRAYDAVQLASCVEAGVARGALDAITFVTADERLGDAARSEKIPVAMPGVSDDLR